MVVSISMYMGLINTVLFRRVLNEQKPSTGIFYIFYGYEKSPQDMGRSIVSVCIIHSIV